MKQFLAILAMCCTPGLALSGPTVAWGPSAPSTSIGKLGTPVVYHGDTIFAPLTGIVVAIRADGAMYIADPLPRANDPNPLPIKQWSLLISPEAAEIITLGREINCDLYGESPTAVYANCWVVIRSEDETGLSQSYAGVAARREPLTQVAVDMGLGSVTECTKEERSVAEAAEGLRAILRSLCP
jgi:hypothetical protein